MNKLRRNLDPTAYAVATSLDEETVLLNTHTGRYYLLDAVGQRMWNLILDLGQVGLVLDSLVEEYNVPENQLERDLLDLVDELERNGLLCEAAQEPEKPV
jgi:hypothetical protein